MSASFSPAPSRLRDAPMGRRGLTNRVMLALCLLCGVLVLVPLVVILTFVVSQGIASVRPELLTQLPDPTSSSGGGLLNAITGTLLLIVLSCLVGLPIGLLSGVYLAEYGRGRLADAIRFTCDVMAGLPSIIAGLVAYGVIVVATHGFSALSGGVALGLLMFPTVTRATEAVLRLVPRSLREGGLALGLPYWRVVLRVVVPAASGGIATSIILGIARVSGETAPLLFTAFGSNETPHSLMGPVSALPLVIFTDIDNPDPRMHALAWAGALVLIGLVFALNLLARYLARRYGGVRS